MLRRGIQQGGVYNESGLNGLGLSNPFNPLPKFADSQVLALRAIVIGIGAVIGAIVAWCIGG
jgi:hypothetical protein